VEEQILLVLFKRNINLKIKPIGIDVVANKMLKRILYLRKLMP
jgi:hypothetical protein